MVNLRKKYEGSEKRGTLVFFESLLENIDGYAVLGDMIANDDCRDPLDNEFMAKLCDESTLFANFFKKYLIADTNKYNRERHENRNRDKRNDHQRDDRRQDDRKDDRRRDDRRNDQPQLQRHELKALRTTLKTLNSLNL